MDVLSNWVLYPFDPKASNKKRRFRVRLVWLDHHYHCIGYTVILSLSLTVKVFPLLFTVAQCFHYTFVHVPYVLYNLIKLLFY